MMDFDGSLSVDLRLKEYKQKKYMAWLNNMKCSGNERSLFDCVHDGLKTHNCGQGRKAGIICKSKGEVHYKLCFDLKETGIYKAVTSTFLR